jgi:hypothetical protein
MHLHAGVDDLSADLVDVPDRQRPFHPFDIHLADGRSLPLASPEFLAVTPPGRTIGAGLADGTIGVVDLLLVTTLKPHVNGHGRRRRSRR